MLQMAEPVLEITITEEHVPVPMMQAPLVAIKEPELVATILFYPRVEGEQLQIPVIPGLHSPVTEQGVQQIPAADIPQEQDLVLPAERIVHQQGPD